MHALAFTLRGRAPPEQHAQFQWIAETVADRTNQLRGSICLISALSLLDPRPGPYTKGPRLLTVFLARHLLLWPASVLNAVFSPASYPHSANLPIQARKWVRSGCFDALSGLSMAPVKEHVLNAFGAAFPSAPQNRAADEPPDPPPRRTPPEPKLAAREISQPKARNRTAKAPRHDAGDQPPGAHPQPSGSPAKPVRMVAVPPPPPLHIPAPIALHEDLAKAPFVRQLHPKLADAAVATGFSVKDFIADMIAGAIRQKAGISPLAPQPFLQVLSRASFEVPGHLLPHAMFIQRTLYDFARLLPTRGSLQAPAAIIRQVTPI
jgi:hypothetical protein